MDDALRNELSRQGVFTTSLEELYNWGRKNSLWPLSFGLACCAIEMMAASMARWDLARFGAEVFRPSPRQADLMIVAGRVSQKMAPVLRQIYDQMPEPKWVISMGACASSGGMFRSYAVVQGIDQFMPVDVYVSGCPPRPDAFLEGLLLLRDSIGKEKRPLSWVIGPQGISRPEKISVRDLKNEERMKMGSIRPMNEI